MQPFPEEHHADPHADGHAQIGLGGGAHAAQGAQQAEIEGKGDRGREHREGEQGQQGCPAGGDGPRALAEQTQRQQDGRAAQQRSGGGQYRVHAAEPPSEEGGCRIAERGPHDGELGQGAVPEALPGLQADDAEGAQQAAGHARPLACRGGFRATCENGEQYGEKGRGGIEHRRQRRVHRLLGPGDQGEWHDAVESGLHQERRPGPSIPRQVQAAPAGDAEQQQACNEGTGRDQGERRNGFDSDADEGVGRSPAGGESEQQGQLTDEGGSWAGSHGGFSGGRWLGHRKVSLQFGKGCFVLERRVASCTGAAERLYRAGGDPVMPREARRRGR